MNYRNQQIAAQRDGLSHKDINRLKALINERWQEVWQAAQLKTSTTSSSHPHPKP